MNWRADLERLPQLAPPFEACEPSTCLVVVDMQYLDAHREYGFGTFLRERYPAAWEYYFTQIEQVALPNVQLLLERFRCASMPVLHLTLGSELPDGSDLAGPDAPYTSAGLVFDRSSFEHGILPELAPIDGELVINKTTRSPFNSTALERTLRILGIRTLLVTGVATSACVELTARDAADRGFSVAIIEDAVADIDARLQENALLQFAVRWGAVLTSAEAVSLVEQAARKLKEPLQ